MARYLVLTALLMVPAAAHSGESPTHEVVGAIKDSVDLGPTLVVWLLDRTASSKELVQNASRAAQDFYDSKEVAAWSSEENPQLLTAIVGFDDKAAFLLDPPTSDCAKIKAVLDGLKPSGAAREMTFTAIKQALEKYQSLRTKERREVIFVVITDEAGDDGQLVDELVEPFRKLAIPVYAIGLPAPWGQTNPFVTNSKVPSTDEKQPTLGPESLFSERVDIQSRLNNDLIDSGCGPFALERLCRASHGQFLALRQAPGSRDNKTKTWPSSSQLAFDPKVQSKYVPDYISTAAYEKSLLENKAKAVLVEAAKLPKLKLDGQPNLQFQKDTEAKMATKMSEAQRYAARNSPTVDHLCELLLKGEADRAKLTSPRWQAEFDLALGLALATKTRLDGYNSMIAALKRGKNFEKPDSKTWVLEPADNYETESTIKKQADKAKMYLDRVARDHVGTPWAKIAEAEKVDREWKLGWKWIEK